MKRPFWIHQVAEYVLGLLLVAQGLQSPQPLAPALAGALVVVNTAIVRGAPLSAFGVVGRAQHRVMDLVVLVVVVLLAVQPWIDVMTADRVVMAGVAVVLGFVWVKSDFQEKQRRAPGESGDFGAEVGRRAGRLVSDGINAAKRYGKR